MNQTTKLNDDPITITLLAHDHTDAEMVHFLYEEYVDELPDIFEAFKWGCANFPVELYLIFPNKRTYGKFLRELMAAKTTVDILTKY